MNGEVIEERSTDFRSLRVGTVKRLFKIIDVDRLIKECKTGQDIVNYLMARVATMSGLFEDIVKDMFDLTDEQYDKQVEMDDLVAVIHILIAESMRRLETTEEGLKNLLRAE